MFLYTELKIQAIQHAARYVAEKRTGDPLPPVENPSLEEARRVDKYDRDFRLAARHCQSLYTTTTDPIERGDALVELIQQRTNLGDYGEVRRLIKAGDQVVGNTLSYEGIPSPARRFKAKLRNREGWLNEYEMNPRGAIQSFEVARQLLRQIGRDNWTDELHELWRTTTHFLGREHFFLAELGSDREENLDLAIGYFETDLQAASDRRRSGLPVSPDNEAYQHAWLSRCNLRSGDIPTSREHLEQAGNGFEDAESKLGSGVIAHYYLTAGEHYLYTGNMFRALGLFDAARSVYSQSKEPYPFGIANANLGLAAASFKLRDYRDAWNFLMEAKRAQPLAIARAVALGLAI